MATSNPAGNSFSQGLVNTSPQPPSPMASANGAPRPNADEKQESSPLAAVGGRDDDEQDAAPARSWGSIFGNAALMLAAGAVIAVSASTASGRDYTTTTPQQPSYPCPRCRTLYQWRQWSPVECEPSRAFGPGDTHRDYRNHRDRDEQTRREPQLGLFPACHCPTAPQQRPYPCPRCGTPYQWYHWSPSERGPQRALGPRDVYRREQTRDASYPQPGLFPACCCFTGAQSSPTGAPTRSPSTGRQGYTAEYSSRSPSQQFIGGVPTNPYANTYNTAHPYGSTPGFNGNITTTGTSGWGYQERSTEPPLGGRSQTALSTSHRSTATFAPVPIGGSGPVLAREQRVVGTIPPVTSTPLWQNNVTGAGVRPNPQGTRTETSRSQPALSIPNRGYHNPENFASTSIGGGVPASEQGMARTMRSDTSTPLSSHDVIRSGVQPCLEGLHTKTPNYVSDGRRSQTAPSTSHRNTANFASVLIGERGPATASEQHAASAMPRVTSVPLSRKNGTSQDGVNATYSGSTNEDLVSNMFSRGFIKSDAVADVMRAVDRAHYVTDKAKAYRPVPHHAKQGLAVLAPHIQAAILEAILPYFKAGSHVLDVGTGAGMFAAMLYHRTGKDGVTVSLSPCAEVIDSAKKNLIVDGLDQVLQKGRILLIKDDGESGYAPCSPYDVIHVTKVMEEIPPRLLTQLASPGRMLIPIRTNEHHAMIQVDKDVTGKVSRRDIRLTVRV